MVPIDAYAQMDVTFPTDMKHDSFAAPNILYVSFIRKNKCLIYFNTDWREKEMCQRPLYLQIIFRIILQ